MKKIWLSLFTFLFLISNFSQTSKSPIPLIFVHEINSNPDDWFLPNFEITFLLANNYTWAYQEVHIQLDTNRNCTCPFDSMKTDVILSSSIYNHDFYLINFDTDSTCTRIKMDGNNILNLQDNIDATEVSFDVN